MQKGWEDTKAAKQLAPYKKDIQVKQKRHNLKFTFGMDEVRCQLSENI